MRSLFCCLLLAFCSLLAKAQDNYAVDLIPKELLPYASAVIRNQTTTVEVKDAGNTFYHIQKAITVLNSNGDDMARIVLFYDKANAIKNIKGTIYNEFGKPTGKFSEREFSDESAINGFSLYEDSRVKVYSPANGSYPYTIAYEYDIKSKQTLIVNDWEPNSQPGMAVEKSSYTFICKPDFTIRYKEINMPTKMVTGITKEGLKTYTWQANNIKALRNEPFSPPAETSLSRVKIAPKDFTYAGIKGSYSNWNDLGRWIYDNLLNGRQQLLPETVEQVKQLTKGITDDKEKARILYEYMQKKTRYISVQVGIGGFQPYSATEVDRLNYGDCKGLVNYTQALFNTAGITSWYCVVEAGSNKKISMLNDFASMDQGNHIILCLPFKNDTTFLECTSQKIPFGFLSGFTDDRTVLACTPQGGKLMHTPKYTATQNTQSRKAEFTLDATGNLTGDMQTVYSGTQYDNVEELVDEPFTEEVKTLQKMYSNISNMEINKIDLKQSKKPMPVSIENIKFKAAEFASADNGKLYFSLNPLNRLRPVKDVRNRINPVYINRGFTDEDEITYTLPAGYRLDTEPVRRNLSTPFGKFKASMTFADGKITYKRQIEIKDGTYTKDSYAELVDFYQKVADSDNYTVSLIKN
ncbi:hypothetical protein CKK33_13730 [Mucilaginibacter sp. MD40]|uniref:DUF3857 domain-containing protein n=1 Tax=Mucilaginibacter sp. MD40 TaxID=2029590 RepID=UPI000BAC86D6|nr:DUF3857 domain-containing protein [Mucilaginibacter sp. MD40]PAW94491.1 hypothetical protein CKK33_13730 [Mucilaginibacter sp. MD40]